MTSRIPALTPPCSNTQQNDGNLDEDIFEQNSDADDSLDESVCGSDLESDSDRLEMDFGGVEAERKLQLALDLKSQIGEEAFNANPQLWKHLDPRHDSDDDKTMVSVSASSDHSYDTRSRSRRRKKERKKEKEMLNVTKKDLEDLKDLLLLSRTSTPKKSSIDSFDSPKTDLVSNFLVD